MMKIVNKGYSYYNMKNDSDNNQQFVQNHMQDKIKLYNGELDYRRKLLRTIDNFQRNQWAQIMTLKCRSLYSHGIMTDELVKAVVVLAMLSKQFNCQYDHKGVEEILKQIYIQQVGDKKSNSEVVKVFKEANFNTAEFQILEYEDPWFSRLFRWFSQ